VLEYCTTEEQRPVVRFCLWSKGLNVKDIHKEKFLDYGEKCLSLKVVHSWVETRGKRFTDDEEAETELRNSLRQQLKCFYAAGFDAVVKQWGKCINGGYVEK
jgi:hypothetical protein